MFHRGYHLALEHRTRSVLSGSPDVARKQKRSHSLSLSKLRDTATASEQLLREELISVLTLILSDSYKGFTQFDFFSP